MTITASATLETPVSADDVLAFVLDLERYRVVDPKIAKVLEPATLGPDHVGTARYLGKLKGLPPAPDTVIVTLVPGRSLTFAGHPRQPGRLLFDFVGTFVCTPLEHGCMVEHSYRLTFRRPLRWVLEKRLRQWLQDDLVGEMERFAAALAADETS